MFGGKEKKEATFVRLNGGVKGPGGVNIYVDVRTGVQYLFVHEPGDAGGVTVIVDENGKPLLHEEYRPT